MGKSGIKTGGASQSSSFKVKTYSISDILASGGATAFANQLGKKPQNTVTRLKAFPREAFLTDAEAQLALDTLKNSK